MTFRIKEARTAANLTQQQLSDMLGISYATLSGYETGAHDPETVYMLYIIESPANQTGLSSLLKFAHHFCINRWLYHPQGRHQLVHDRPNLCRHFPIHGPRKVCVAGIVD